MSAKYKLVGGPLNGQEISATVAPPEIRRPAFLNSHTSLEKMQIDVNTTVDVAEYRYIRQQFVLQGKDVTAYRWEHTMPAEALELLKGML